MRSWPADWTLALCRPIIHQEHMEAICSSRRFGIDIGSTHYTANDGFHDHYQKSMVPTGRTCSPRYLERRWQGPWVSRFLNQTTGEASAGFGVPFSTTCS